MNFQGYKESCKWCNHQAAKYYSGNPEVSDLSYDEVFRELEKYEKQNPSRILSYSPTQRVGSPVVNPAKAVAHVNPMLSLDNAFENNAKVKSLTNWSKNHTEETSYVATTKLDGYAIEPVYAYGKLVRAVSRGDGQKGDDVTHLARTIRTIPLIIKDWKYCAEVQIVGEVVISKEDWKAWKAAGNAGEDPRNLVAGTFNPKTDPKKAAERPLTFVPYDLKCEQLAITHYHLALYNLKALGFVTVPSVLYFSKSELLKDIDVQENVDFVYHNNPFPSDGIVVRVNKQETFNSLGTTAHHPKGAIAYKPRYLSKTSTTKVNRIYCTVGLSGLVTPVADLEPVKVGNVTVSSAQLYSQKKINELGINVDDTVEVRRAGDVIPEVVSILTKENTLIYKIPVDCPVCGTELSQKGEEIFCVNEECDSRLINKLNRFCSKQALDIKGVAESSLQDLIDAGMIEKVTDLFHLDFVHFFNVDLKGWKEKSVSNFLEAVSDSTETTLNRVLYGLGIKEVGEATAKNICSHFDWNAEAISSADYFDFLEVKDIGEVTAESLVDWFSEEDNLDTWNELTEELLTLRKPEVKKSNSSVSLKGKKVVITGTFSINRDKLKSIVESLGGKVITSVSKNTDLLLCGNEYKSKYNKAIDLGIEIWEEDKVEKLLIDV